MPAVLRRPSLVRALAWSWLAFVVACGEKAADSPNGGAGTGGASGGTGGTVAGTGGSTTGGTGGASGTTNTTGGTGGTAGGATGGSAGTSPTGGSSTGGTSPSGGAGQAGTSPSAGTTSAGTGGASGSSAGTSATTGGTSGTTAGSSGTSGGSAGSGGMAPLGPPRILVFSKTAGYRHESIADGITMLLDIAEERNWTLRATEDAADFNDAELANYDVTVFLSPTLDIFDEAQQGAFERFVKTPAPNTKGYVGIHSASDAEFDWPFYGELVGAYFREHPPDLQMAKVVVEDATHPATSFLPTNWMRTDEWYAFRTNPRANVHVLLSLDETSYTPGTANMMGDHPIAWWHIFNGCRVFHTALGHTRESYTEPLFVQHITAAVEWAAGR